MKVYDTIIVGGGASGMAAALACAGEGQEVLLLERMEKVGKKILVTGNGKCNLTNRHQSLAKYRTDAPACVETVFSQYGLEETMALFASLGIHTKDKNGYVYPYNEQAASVREAFEEKLLSLESLLVQTRMKVSKIRKSDTGFLVSALCLEAEETQGKVPTAKEKGQKIKSRKDKSQESSKRTFAGKSLILATGGLAGGKFGCDGSGYGFAKSLGHHVLSPFPALTALKSSAPFLKKVSGVRNQAHIKLLVNGEIVGEDAGELQWTEYGISGVAIFGLSRFAVFALEKGKKVTLLLDFMPELSGEEVVSLLKNLQKNCGYKTKEQLLCGIFPAKLSPVLLREAERSKGGSLSGWTEEVCGSVAGVIKAFPLRICGYLGYEKAQVTCGGVPLGELTDQLESRFCDGLFFAGEVTDVDGTCGGYNLQWAFSSGSVAGRAARKRNQTLQL